MTFSELISQGEASPVLLLLMAMALGALHGLEPGHSKTMIAAYVIAIRERSARRCSWVCRPPCRTSSSSGFSLCWACASATSSSANGWNPGSS